MEKSKEEILNMAYEKGKQYELEYGNCSQCTLAGIFDALDIESEDVFRSATGLADGVGLTRNGQCGALSGGVLAISYLFGRGKEDFGNVRKVIKSCILSKKLHDQILEKYGTCRCSDIQIKLMGRVYDMYNPAEYEQSVKDGFLNYSSTVVGEVARMATQIILEEREREAARVKA